ncbi:MAG: right-handed parallel beta-helix repeat-containing protein [Candidatus Brocadiia bacterium]
MPATIKVGKTPYDGETNETIQRAINDVAERGGGTVELPARTFELHDAIHLRSSVTLAGQGKETVLKKVQSVSSPIVDHLGYGHYEVTVEDPDLFRPGMGITVRDDSTNGFNMTVGTIQEIDGACLFIDKQFNADYSPNKGGRAVSIFPLVSAEYARGVAMRDLTLDGSNDPELLGGCRGGAVFFLQTHTATAENLHIQDFTGDGISFQQCTDIAVKRCEVHDLAENGLHPGSGSVRYVIEDNHVHNCGGMGIFYCLRTTHSLCEGNLVENNGRGGISIGERDTNHILRNNEIKGNSWAGLRFRDVHIHGGDRVIVEENNFEQNANEQDEAEIVIASRIRHVVIRQNQFITDASAIRVNEETQDIYVAASNKVDGQPIREPDVVGSSEEVNFGDADHPLEIGPAAAHGETSRHLSVELPRRPANF